VSAGRVNLHARNPLGEMVKQYSDEVLKDSEDLKVFASAFSVIGLSTSGNKRI